MRWMKQLALAVLLAGAVLAPSPRTAVAVPAAQDPGDDVLAQIESIKSAPPIDEDHFRVDDGRWDTDSDEDVTRSYQTGTYRMAINTKKIISWSLSDIEADDFYLEVDTYHTGGPVNNELGVVFRYQDSDNFYLYDLSSDGYYHLRKKLNGEWTDLVDWTQSDALNQGEGAANTLGLLADGSQITLLANDTVLDTVEDSDLTGGTIGFAAGSFDEPGVEVAFDDLQVWSTTPGVQPEPSAEPTIEPGLTPEPTATVEVVVPDAGTVQAQLEEIRSNDTLLSDEFRRDNGIWELSDSEDATIAIKNRELRLDVLKDNLMTWSTANADVVNFLIEADASQLEGPTDANYGVVVHVQGDDMYFFSIDQGGNYAFWRKAGGEWNTLIDWTASDALEQGVEAVNRLGVLADGATLTLLANDTALAQVADMTPGVGNAGVAAGVQNDPGAVVVFDNVDIWELPGEAPVATSTPEPVATETPAPVATPLPPETTAGDLDAIRAGDPLVSDDFRRDTGDWGVSSDGDSTIEIAGRALSIQIKRPDFMSWTTVDNPVADFLYEADTNVVAGYPNMQYGLVFRFVDNDNFYYAALDPAGEYSLWKKVAGEWTALIDRQASDAIETGEEAANGLGVLAQGTQLTVIINGTPVGMAEDDTFAEGSFGVAAEAFTDAADGVEVTFDNVALWEVKG